MNTKKKKRICILNDFKKFLFYDYKGGLSLFKRKEKRTFQDILRRKYKDLLETFSEK